MPAVSQKQQRFMGMVHNCQKTGNCPSAAVSKVAHSIKPQDAEDFARTKRSDLPVKKGKMFDESYSFKNWLLTKESN